MFRSTLLRQVSRASATAVRPPTFTAASISRHTIRTFTKSSAALEKQDDSQSDDAHDRYSTASAPGETEYEGAHSRTDNTIKFEHPEEAAYPQSKLVQGRGGYHFKRTLATFSLEGRVGVVTGGARGLGLVMSQALILSGANVAIVDLNSK
jgi:D-arabinitol 2-dehydrogenase